MVLGVNAHRLARKTEIDEINAIVMRELNRWVPELKVFLELWAIQNLN